MIEKKTESCSNKNCCFELKDYGLLVLRLILGIFMLTHGWAKLSNFSEMSQGFPAMLGMSPALGLSLIIFAEFFCSIALLFGFLTRLAVIPLIIGMSVAAFVAHAGAPFNGRELPLLYLAMYVVLLLTGPGKIALDTLIYNRFCPHSKKGKEA